MGYVMEKAADGTPIPVVFCEWGESVFAAAAREFGSNVFVRLPGAKVPAEFPAFLGRVAAHRTEPGFPVYGENLPETETLTLYRFRRPSMDSLPVLPTYPGGPIPEGCLRGFPDRGDLHAGEAAREMSQSEGVAVDVYREVWVMPRFWVRETRPIARRAEFLASYLNGEKVSQ